MIYRVTLTRDAQKQLRRVPRHVAVKLQAWIEMVETDGLTVARRIPGFHDEPLHGSRRGQRSIRLSRAYRAIYEIGDDEIGRLVNIEEVNKHDY